MTTNPHARFEGHTPELLPCPFCGAKASLCEFKTKDGSRYKYDGVHGQIECSNEDCEMYSPNCFYFIEGEEGNEKLDMIKAWNTRTPVPDLLAENIRLRAALDAKEKKFSDDMLTVDLYASGREQDKNKSLLDAKDSEIARLRETLEFYANEKNYVHTDGPHSDEGDFDYYSKIELDRGQKARTALNLPTEKGEV